MKRENFIPEIFKSTVLIAFYNYLTKMQLFGKSNLDYFGEIVALGSEVDMAVHDKEAFDRYRKVQHLVIDKKITYDAPLLDDNGENIEDCSDYLQIETFKRNAAWGIARTLLDRHGYKIFNFFASRILSAKLIKPFDTMSSKDFIRFNFVYGVK